jgi:hypothetical protein
MEGTVGKARRACLRGQKRHPTEFMFNFSKYVLRLHTMPMPARQFIDAPGGTSDWWLGSTTVVQ